MGKWVLISEDAYETLYERFGDVIDFPELGATLALSDIYDGLDFKREPAREPVRLG